MLQGTGPVWPRYHRAMSKQIAVRLPDEVVEFMDQMVAAGSARSRADLAARALRREQRREAALRDVAILAAIEPDPDLETLASSQDTTGTSAPDS